MKLGQLMPGRMRSRTDWGSGWERRWRRQARRSADSRLRGWNDLRDMRHHGGDKFIERCKRARAREAADGDGGGEGDGLAEMRRGGVGGAQQGEEIGVAHQFHEGFLWGKRF